MNKFKPNDNSSLKCVKYNENNMDELNTFIKIKILRLQEIIRNTMISIKNNYQYEIFSNTEMNICINILNDTHDKTREILSTLHATCSQAEFDSLIEQLQKVINKISIIICGYGTSYIEDMLFICFGSEFDNIKCDNLYFQEKYELIKRYVRPIGYKIVNTKPTKLPSTPVEHRKLKSANKQVNANAEQPLSNEVVSNIELCINKITDNKINIENANMLECFDVDATSKTFYQRNYGIRIVIKNDALKKKIIVNGIVIDINLECISNKYIDKRQQEIAEHHAKVNEMEAEVIKNIIDNMTLKDILISGNNDIYNRMQNIFIEVNNHKNLKIELVVKKFLDLDTYSQKNLIANLSMYIKDEANQYIAYLLYDLISMNVSDVDHTEYKYLHDSLPYKIKKYFKEVITPNILKNTESIQKTEKNKISYEHQIHLMKANDSIKEKAMLKLKEIRNKSDESGIKAKQYLDGLLKIPFGVYKEEPILKKIKELNKQYSGITYIIEKTFPGITIVKKEKYTIMEITNHLKFIENYIHTNIFNIIESKMDSHTIKTIYTYLNDKMKNNNDKRLIRGKTKNEQINTLLTYLKTNTLSISYEIYDIINDTAQMNLTKSVNEINTIKSNIKSLNNTMCSIYETMDDSIYGHVHAKNQIMKIIAQWMNGEQSGYCFGFEGPPGIGKTSLAKKGLANCLKDDANESRPFAFIALGGSCNGSYLEGHGYTYINSNWGRITDILMQTKCMNPIIYIDELDKVSKTEAGKEIIGILTHMIDQTQNDVFQDKFFSGIDIDLSKALIIFSYNDVKQIDPILLDRIHRIKFENLSLSDKVVIVKKYILPEINKKMGFENIVDLSDDIIQYIIDTYTAESGVRKLKELLFDLFGEINLQIIRNNDDTELTLPIKIEISHLNKYLDKYTKIEEKCIHKKPEIGIINGLWANAAGKGGITPIECRYYPTTSFFDLKLTGLQGEVMKESMNVAKTLAWNLTSDEVKSDLVTYFEKTKCQGLHIHCPEGAVSKDGPSAGVAITCAIYSLLNKKQIRNDIAITGEITLQGEVTAIGGLDLKISGGIRAGVKMFLYPKSNSKDFLEWKNKTDDYDNTIEFVELTNIEQAIDRIFV